MKNNIEIGEIVKSIAGRDEGNLYLVKEIVDNDFVLLVDGKTKLLSKPKKKRIKHVCKMHFCNEGISNKFNNQTKVFDSEIFSAIKKFSESEKNV